MGRGVRVRRDDQEWKEVLVFGGVIMNGRKCAC